MDRERSRAVRHTLPLSLLMLDVDHFKRVNDTHGHDAGDAVLRGIAAVLKKIARKSDFVSRWGGEEFVVALAQTAEAGGRIAAERVRGRIAETPFMLPRGDAPRDRLGRARQRDGAMNLDELVGRADRALYAAKARGRRVAGDGERGSFGVAAATALLRLGSPTRPAARPRPSATLAGRGNVRLVKHPLAARTNPGVGLEGDDRPACGAALSNDLNRIEREALACVAARFRERHLISHAHHPGTRARASRTIHAAA